MANRLPKQKGKENPNFKNRVGEKYITNEGYQIEIIEYFEVSNCTVRLEDGNVLKNKHFSSIVKGQIKNPYHKSVYGVGYLGQGNYGMKKDIKLYTIWKSLIQRCYCEKYQEKYPSYKDVTITEDWKCFQNFAKWAEDNYKENCALDKDILIKGNKLYSPETCCFVPHEINQLFVKSNSIRGKYPIGVFKSGNVFLAKVKKKGKIISLGRFNTPEDAFDCYKFYKEAYIKEMAEEYKDQIDSRVYEAMYNYQVETTD